MSYILDALKKSDQERKRGDLPSLQTVHIPVSTAPSTPWVLYGLISVLIIGLAFALGLLVSGKSANQPLAAYKARADSVPMDKENVPPAAFQASPLNPSDVQQPPHQKRIKPLEPQEPASGAQAESAPHMASPALLKQQPAQASGQSRSLQAELDLSEVPYLEELEDFKQQSVPDLSFAGHVYSSIPSSRSVIINGAAMSEGDMINEALSIEQITPSGIVFRHQWGLFRVDILQDWSFE